MQTAEQKKLRKDEELQTSMDLGVSSVSSKDGHYVNFC